MNPLHLLKPGDSVWWRAAWGKDLPVEAIISYIVLKGENDEVEVSAAPWELLQDERYNRQIIVGLENGHWAFGYQLEPLL